jgi:hypothetical protein
MQPPKSATDVKYIGVYKQKQEALDAFFKAFVELPLEKRAFCFTDSPPVFIGIRNCRRHYLVRSEGVPADLPCEQCAGKSYSKPNDIVLSSSSDLLPQFIWHGKSYLEKIWTDFDFLTENIAIKKFLPELVIKGNPLLLSNDKYFKALESIGVNIHDPLRFLRGRLEQVEEAAKASITIPEKVNRYSFMGTAYQENMLASLFKSLKHDENGFLGNKWKDQATRWNQLRFQNEVCIVYFFTTFHSQRPGDRLPR